MGLLDLLEMGEACSSLSRAVLSVSVSPPELVLEAAKHRHTDCTDRAARSVEPSCTCATSPATVVCLHRQHDHAGMEAGSQLSIWHTKQAKQ